MRRVVVTGIGLISPLGANQDETWHGALNAKNVTTQIPSKWKDYSKFDSTLWAPLPDNLFEKLSISRVDKLQFDPATLLALSATQEAISNARLVVRVNERNFFVEGIDSEIASVYLGTGIGGSFSFQSNHAFQYAHRSKQDLDRLNSSNKLLILDKTINRLVMPARFNPLAVSQVMPNASAAAIGIRYGLKGTNRTICSACASGTVAIGLAYESIREGRSHFVISGGTEYLYDDCGGIYKSFDIANTLSKSNNPETANCPFDVKRTGFLFSEGGAAILILEDLQHAMNRNAPIIAEIIGYEENSDAHNMVSPEKSGIQLEKLYNSLFYHAEIAADE